MLSPAEARAAAASLGGGPSAEALARRVIVVKGLLSCTKFRQQVSPLVQQAIDGIRAFADEILNGPSISEVRRSFILAHAHTRAS